MTNLLIFALVVLICSGYQALNERLNRIADRVACRESIIASEEMDELWSEYKALHDGVLRNESEGKREFSNRVHEVIDHNRLYKHGVYTYKLGIHEYFHISYDEFNKVMNGIRPPKGHWLTASNYKGFHGNDELFERSLWDDKVVDWRKKNAVTSVKSQGGCASCYAFAAAGALEGMHALAGYNLTSFSVQQLLDCTINWGNFGCRGGLMDPCYKYVQSIQGIQSSDSYPYSETQSMCKYDSSRAISSCDGFVRLPRNDERSLLEAVYHIGPVAVAIDGLTPKFLSYKEGIFSDYECSPDNINHGVLLIGYGTEIINNRSYPYWLIKNSWGESWGEGGYMKMSRRQRNICGIASMCTYPILKERRRADLDWE